MSIDVFSVSHEKVGYIRDDEIFFASHGKAGYIRDNDVFFASHGKAGYIRDNDVFFASHDKAGYVRERTSNVALGAAALLLLYEKPIQSSSSDHEEKENFSGWTLFFLALLGIFKFVKWEILTIIRAFDFKHTATRKQWWGSLVGMFLLLIIGVPLMASTMGDRLIVYLIFILILLVILACISIRRAWDAGKPFWLALIPLVNFVICGFFPRKTDGNPYSGKLEEED